MAPATTHPVFSQPADRSISLWRYMDFTKFVSMLEKTGLFFSRSDLIGDPFEGSVTAPTVDQNLEQLRSMVPSKADEWARTFAGFNKEQRSWTFVNCWHANEHESAAMWRLYSKSNDEAVAIRTTLGLLCDCLDEECFVGKVTYIDYDNAVMPSGNALWPYVHKRLSFAHEREYRAAVVRMPIEGSNLNWGAPKIAGGIWKSVDLNALIQDVRVSPTSADWFHVLVNDVGRRYGLERTVKKSPLGAEPIW